MSDITIRFSLVDWIVLSPTLGWPGLLVGGLIGALWWKRRRLLGAALGAIVGNAMVFLVRILML